jgi:hypothetical protein
MSSILLKAAQTAFAWLDSPYSRSVLCHMDNTNNGCEMGLFVDAILEAFPLLVVVGQMDGKDAPTLVLQFSSEHAAERMIIMVNAKASLEQHGWPH